MLILALGAALGIRLDSLLVTTFTARLCAWGILAILSFGLFLYSSLAVRRIAILVLMTCLGAVWQGLCDHRFESASILDIATESYEPAIIEGDIDRPVAVRRKVNSELLARRDQSLWESMLEIDLTRIRSGQSFIACDGRVMVRVEGKLDHLLPGDRVRAYGAISKISGPTNPGERDYRTSCRSRGIHARMDVDDSSQIVVLGSHYEFDRGIATIATQSKNTLLEHAGEDMGPLAVALVIGQREYVDSETRDSLLVTGTAHLLSVSGLHLAIVILIASWVATLLRFPLTARIVWVLTICCIYTAITGGRPPVLRAAILVGMLMLSLWFKRASQPINTLAFAALILMAINPENLFHIGVQLSFLAVTTLYLCGARLVAASPSNEESMEAEKELDKLIDSSRTVYHRVLRFLLIRLGQVIWFSACVTAMSLPLVWYEFHVVSLVSVATNVLLSPFLFLSLASGVATVVLGWMSDSLASVPGWFCYAGLRCMSGIIDTAAAIPYGHFWLPSPPRWWIVTFYLVMVASLLLPSSRRTLILRTGWIAIWIFSAWWIATTSPTMDDTLIEATFVDVGHGTSVVIRDNQDHSWLYDCGRLANELGDSRDIDVTLWALGITRLDGIILSHADSDHYNAIPGVLARFGCTRIITPPEMLLSDEPGLVPIRQAIERKGIPVMDVSAGESLPGMNDSSSSFFILHPPLARVDGSDNANSLVVAIDTNEKTLLLPGDLEPPGTDSLIAHPRPRPGGILMAPHHGSLSMNAVSILQWSRPSAVVVSGGRRARKPEVREMLNITGAAVHVTAEVGSIRVRIHADGEIEVRSWSQSPW